MIAACELKKTKYPENEVSNSNIQYMKYIDTDIWKNMNTGYCVTKMYHHSIFDKVMFDESISMCENALFLNSVLEKYKACCATDSAL